MKDASHCTVGRMFPLILFEGTHAPVKRLPLRHEFGQDDDPGLSGFQHKSHETDAMIYLDTLEAKIRTDSGQKRERRGAGDVPVPQDALVVLARPGRINLPHTERCPKKLNGRLMDKAEFDVQCVDISAFLPPRESPPAFDVHAPLAVEQPGSPGERRRFNMLPFKHSQLLPHSSGCSNNYRRQGASASSGRKTYRSSFIPGLHDTPTVFIKPTNKEGERI